VRPQVDFKTRGGASTNGRRDACGVDDGRGLLPCCGTASVTADYASGLGQSHDRQRVQSMPLVEVDGPDDDVSAMDDLPTQARTIRGLRGDSAKFTWFLSWSDASVMRIAMSDRRWASENGSHSAAGRVGQVSATPI